MLQEYALSKYSPLLTKATRTLIDLEKLALGLLEIFP